MKKKTKTKTTEKIFATLGPGTIQKAKHSLIFKQINKTTIGLVYKEKTCDMFPYLESEN